MPPLERQKDKQFFHRIIIVTFVFCALFSLLGYRAFDLQVKRSSSFRQMVEMSQYLTLRLPARRGDIYDRNMNPLAISVEVDSVYANPRIIRNKKALAQKIAPILGLPVQRLFRLLLQDRYFVWFKRHITRRQMFAIHRLRLTKKLRVVQERKRFYPNQQLAAHVIGYTDRDGRGLAGVERFFDRLLRGKKRSIRLPHDPKGRHILHPKKLSFSGSSGAGVVLTIDKTIQYIAEKALQKAVDKAKAKQGIAIVMDPNNGDLLALAISPTFNPNRFRKVSTKTRTNAALSNPYEPGSTMKVVSIAIARHLKVFRLGEQLNCENGRMRIGRYTIRDDHPYKMLTPLGTMKYSSNICTAKLAQRVGKYKFHQYLQRFGFGQRTNIGLPWETKGIMHPPKRWAQISFANIAFGQGISVTPLQLTAAVGAVANGGIYYKPRLYRSIVDSKGRVLRSLAAQTTGRVISKQAANDISRMMVAVVEAGTGKNAQIEGVSVAGKTGTAQKPRTNGRGYGKGRIGSFVGFLPAKNPRLTILVVIDEPKGSKYGGVVAAPAFKEIAIASMQYLGQLASGKLRFQRIHTVPFVGNKKGVNRPSRSIYASSTNSTSPSARLSMQTIKTHSAKVRAYHKTPSVIGLSLRELTRKAKKWKLKIRVIGRGKARYQRPTAGAPLPKNRRIVVVFTSK